jgi:hypothetical protein
VENGGHLPPGFKNIGADSKLRGRLILILKLIFVDFSVTGNLPIFKIRRPPNPLKLDENWPNRQICELCLPLGHHLRHFVNRDYMLPAVNLLSDKEIRSGVFPTATGSLSDMVTTALQHS